MENKQGEESWKRINYRDLKISELFNALKDLGVTIDPDSFLQAAEQYDSPEDLVEGLLSGNSDEDFIQKIYLLMFEIWRRLCKNKQSLSIFCDELDYQFGLFENEGSNSEVLQEMIEELEDILDMSVDDGEDPQKTFQLVSAYLAHNLEDFIYQYASYLIDEGNTTAASELVGAFQGYVQSQTWFDFLKVRLVFAADPKEAGVMLIHLLERIQDDPDLELLFEVLNFLVYAEEIPLFFQAFELASHLIEKEKDFQELVEICMNYLNSLDCDSEEILLQKILDRRKKHTATDIIKVDDEDLVRLTDIVSKVPL